MRVLEFTSNPFRAMLPGGSPTDRWANPPTVHFGMTPFLVLFWWDRATIEKKQSAFNLAHHFVGVSGQGIARNSDGEEFYIKTFDKGGCWLTPTGFRGQPFTPILKQPTKLEITDMTILTAFHDIILERYSQTEGVAEEVQEMCDGVADDLRTCHTLAETKLYLGWPEHDWMDLVEEFFTRDTASYTDQ